MGMPRTNREECFYLWLLFACPPFDYHTEDLKLEQRRDLRFDEDLLMVGFE